MLIKNHALKEHNVTQLRTVVRASKNRCGARSSASCWGAVRRSCSRSRRGRDGKGPLEHDRVDREHVNVIETKFGRAVRRCEGGLEVTDNEQLLPLCERTVSPTHRHVDRHLLHAAVDHRVRNLDVVPIARLAEFAIDTKCV